MENGAHGLNTDHAVRPAAQERNSGQDGVIAQCNLMEDVIAPDQTVQKQHAKLFPAQVTYYEDINYSCKIEFKNSEELRFII